MSAQERLRPLFLAPTKESANEPTTGFYWRGADFAGSVTDEARHRGMDGVDHILHDLRRFLLQRVQEAFGCGFARIVQDSACVTEPLVEPKVSEVAAGGADASAQGGASEGPPNNASLVLGSGMLVVEVGLAAGECCPA